MSVSKVQLCINDKLKYGNHSKVHTLNTTGSTDDKDKNNNMNNHELSKSSSLQKRLSNKAKKMIYKQQESLRSLRSLRSVKSRSSHQSFSHTGHSTEDEFRFVLSTSQGFEAFAHHCISGVYIDDN